MLCQNCQKNEATVHLTEIKDGKIISVHLCQQCAEKKGINVKTPFSLGDFLSGLADLNVAPEEEALTCPQCGMTLAEFRSEGRLGCGRCYRIFARSLFPLIKTIQKGAHHRGKVPAVHPVRPDLEELKKALREAVEKEEFEAAARLRDQIKKYDRSKNEN